jgi:enoyl-CoA hydratase/carnithine racemase
MSDVNQNPGQTEPGPLLYDVSEGIATLTLNRPEKLNAFTPAMLSQWLARLEEAQGDRAVQVVVITGAGRGFCSGGDVGNMGKNEALAPLDIKENLRNTVQRIPLQVARMDKPVIAAVNGVATGAGLDLALMCDLRFAAAGARLGETYSKVGLVPGAGGAYFLPRLVGTAKALELFWGAELLTADEALRLGLVNRVYPDAELMARTREFALRVAKAPPLSIRLIKRAVYQSRDMDLPASLDLISSHMVLARSSADHAEAVAALREKRDGVYAGR